MTRDRGIRQSPRSVGTEYEDRPWSWQHQPAESKILWMPRTERAELGSWGEELVGRSTNCLRCTREQTVRRLPNNFKCADLIFDSCGYLAQVKSTVVSDVDDLPSTLLGAAWAPSTNASKPVSTFLSSLFSRRLTVDNGQSSTFQRICRVKTCSSRGVHYLRRPTAPAGGAHDSTRY
jgi:hypothetical protein